MSGAESPLTASKQVTHMNHVERFRAVMDFQTVDRLPRWEWAMWWDQTIDAMARRGAARAVPERLRHLAVLRAGPLHAVLVQHDRGDDRGHAAPRRGHRREHGRLPRRSPAALPAARRGDRIDAAVGRAAEARRRRGLDHVRGLLLVPADADGHRAADVRLLRPARADPPDQPGPHGLPHPHAAARSPRSACRRS